jgi:hypothetical protein
LTKPCFIENVAWKSLPLHTVRIFGKEGGLNILIKRRLWMPWKIVELADRIDVPFANPEV